MTDQQPTTLIPVVIKSVDEPWTVITLIDGSVVRTKLVITGCSAVYDSNGNHLISPDNQLLYAVEHAMIHKVTSSPLLLQQVKGVSN